MTNIIGRTKERNSLYNYYDVVKDGKGQLVLVSGEAGVGKTTLVEETLEHSGLQIFIARCNDEGTPPYGPIVTILRNCMRDSNKNEFDCGSLSKFLPLILPELGDAPDNTDAETLKEAITAALFNIASKKATAIFIDDIHWADSATFELLTAIVDKLHSKNLIFICTYRSDDITRDHKIKKFKNDLRRRRKLNEVTIEPFSFDSTRKLIFEILKAEPSKGFTEKVFNITQGFPLFIEELIDSFIRENLLMTNDAEINFIDDAEISLPETLKDVLLTRVKNLSNDAKLKLEICAVAGQEFNPELVIKISGNEKGFDELIGRNILTVVNPETFKFRHALIRDAVNSQIIWSKRRSLHKEIAEQLSTFKAHPDIIASHWLASGQIEKAKTEFLISADKSCKIYAYSDAAHVLNKALELWSEDQNSEQKTDALLLYAKCSQLTGNLNETIKALNEIIGNNNEEVSKIKVAETHRMLATVYALRGAGELSAESRLKAAEFFYNNDRIADAALELLTAAGRYTALLKLNLGYEYAIKSANYAKEINHLEIETQAQALSGNILAMQGKFEEGRVVVQDALSTAIKNNLSDAASIIYRRLASTLEYASDYNSARDAYYSAYNYCLTEGKDVSAQICLGCMSNTLFLTGEWKKSLEICDEVIKNSNTPEGSLIIGLLIKGFIFALRGEVKKAVKNINRALELSRKLNIVLVEIGSLWALAIISENASDLLKTTGYYKSILKLWEETQEKHDSIIILIWAASYFAQNSLKQELTQTTQALSVIASYTGNPEALTGLAFAIAENAMMKNNYQQAIDQFIQSIEHSEKLQFPLLQMIILYRLGIAYVKNEDIINAKKYLLSANSISKNLGTRPFSAKIEAQLNLLGVNTQESRIETSDERSSKAGLTRRQSEILELIAEGLTNKEIADKLFLSTRTVDMHVSNMLERLNCRTRIDAINKARELGLV